METMSFRDVNTLSLERGHATVTSTLFAWSETAATGDNRRMDPGGSNLARFLATDCVPIDSVRYFAPYLLFSILPKKTYLGETANTVLRAWYRSAFASSHPLLRNNPQSRQH